MKVILAIHPGYDSAPLTQALSQLALRGAVVEVVSVIEPVTVSAPFSFGAVNVPSNVLTQIEESTNAAAQRVAERISGATTWVPCGDPAMEINARAEATGADLIITGSERKGLFGSLFMGSVTRGLALHGKSSLFLVKQGGADLSTMVFATDMSDYSKKCWESFIAHAPGCLRKLHVTTTVDVSAPNYGWLFPNMADFISIPDPNVEKMVAQQRNMFPESSLPGVEVIHEVVMSDAQDGLATAADERGAGALIVGGQGHTWADRVFIGSVALHHTMHGETNLWLLRP
ncbi:MAG: universal stress protein [Fimbriimonadaceae bacterium]|nr:universal stress protein [Fimbriimonadaceae bacterium]